MKGFFKQRKGFSLVELLIALLIMAIIAGTAITLFGGVLETSKGGADRETADAIKRAILTYMNAANDPDLSALKGAKTKAQDVVNQLACKITISGTTSSSVQIDGTTAGVAGTATDDEIDGVYGPFLEEYGITPKQDGMTAWDIDVDSINQIITVSPTKNDKLLIH